MPLLDYLKMRQTSPTNPVYPTPLFTLRTVRFYRCCRSALKIEMDQTATLIRSGAALLATTDTVDRRILIPRIFIATKYPLMTNRVGWLDS